MGKVTRHVAKSMNRPDRTPQAVVDRRAAATKLVVGGTIGALFFPPLGLYMVCSAEKTLRRLDGVTPPPSVRLEPTRLDSAFMWVLIGGWIVVVWVTIACEAGIPFWSLPGALLAGA